MLKSALTAALIAGATMLSACDKAPSADAVKDAAKSAVTPAPKSELIDPNTIGAFDLAGIEVLSDPAQDAILLARPFATPSAFHAVVSKHADDGLQAMIYEKIFVRVNANTASPEDIMLIPSPLTPKKLAHEVDEYRPYADMRAFERELGKYMNAEEMAQLKRYFFVE